MNTSAPVRASTLPSLTGLRFAAATLVLLYHCSLAAHVSGVSDLVQFGRTGVTFFFVLSGFILAWNYGAHPEVGPFLWRRFARIYPLLVVTTLLSLGAYRLTGNSISLRRLVANLLLIQGWLPGLAPGANPPAWSLSDEAFFYVMFPLIALVVVRWGRHAAASVGVIFAVMVAAWVAVGLVANAAFVFDIFPPARLAQFAIGVVGGLAMRAGWRPCARYWPALVAVIAWHLILIPWSSVVDRSDGFGAQVGSQWLSAPLFLWLIVAAAQADIDGRRTGFQGSTLVHLGEWSYALYLVHHMVIRLWEHYVGFSGSPALVGWLVVFIISQTLAAALFLVVEDPCRRFLTRRGPRWSRRKTVPARA